MKLLGVRLARSIWLIPPYFLNPKGVYIRPALEALKTRYSFRKSPFDTPGTPPPAEGAKYEDGAFSGKNGQVIINSLTIHGDGFVVDTRSSTDDGDAFLEDALTWISKDYGLPSPADLPIKKIYSSELNVILEKPAKFFDPKLASYFEEVSTKIVDDKTGKLDFLSLQISSDQTVSPRQATFRIDREINIPFDQNRYYSFASTKTDIHIKLLEKLEDLL